MPKRIKLCLQHFDKEVIIKRLKIAPDSSLSYLKYQVTAPSIESSHHSNSHGNDCSKAKFSLFCQCRFCIGYYFVLRWVSKSRVGAEQSKGKTASAWKHRRHRTAIQWSKHCQAFHQGYLWYVFFNIKISCSLKSFSNPYQEHFRISKRSRQQQQYT